MSTKFAKYEQLDLSQINKDVLKQWEEDKTFDKSINTREGRPPFVFYEGPPSANGKPGIHHVMARTIKDAVCRYKTQQNFLVHRKAGWDTHGLPVELGVEKSLGITKEDIGNKITVAEYNAACRKDVMKFTGEWEDLTHKMGYWVNMKDPYITYDNKYIETLWWLLKQLHQKDMLYKGYTIQPYSPAAGTGLSSHELNQPGCYRDVKDTTCVAQFEAIKDEKSNFIFEKADTEKVHFIAWTTTPWTLPSNTALAVGNKITYVMVRSFNPYTSEPINVVLAKDLLNKMFSAKNAELKLEDYKEGDKKIPFEVVDEFKGSDLVGINYKQLIDWVTPDEGAFRVVAGDFVTTEDGTGIVHIAPTFGADDARVGKENGIPGLIVTRKDGFTAPLVDRRGRFFVIDNMDAEFVASNVNVDSYADFSGRYVKNEYDESLTAEDSTADIDISVMLKLSGNAFKIEKHVHSYPHCWRTDKPVLYYPLDSWFIKSTAVKDRMIELNKTINWKPQSTGTGRFGKWLENLVDWNLSRSRYWGTPLPIWVNEDRTEEICIGSVAELKVELEKSVTAGFMESNPLADFNENDNSKENYKNFDLHRPFVDDVFLVSSKGEKMTREADLIDVWFDSGAMPFAQMHYPFENKEIIDNKEVFPADFIAEGVDQTRGWFFTLHAIATMTTDSVAFKNIISNGLVLDKAGNKMSKRLGNGIDPFGAIDKYGSDPLRWYMITNAQPWDNLKFDIGGVEEVKRKFFGTLYNTYSFFALYANIDSFSFSEAEVPLEERPEIDRWVISLLNTLIKDVTKSYDNYDLTTAGRLIQEFVMENLSNWYVRLNRRRFWGDSSSQDKLAAYQTLYTCLEKVSMLVAPIAPFFAERLFTDLNKVTNRYSESVHITLFPEFDETVIDVELEERMSLAQRVSSLVLGLRRKVSIKVRQPLDIITVPVNNEADKLRIEQVCDIILSEVNVKKLNVITDGGQIVKKIKPNFKALGPRFGKNMKLAAAAINTFSQEDIAEIEANGVKAVTINDAQEELLLTDVEIITEDMPGWLVASDGRLTVALDITISDELRMEGVAREFVNRIQNLRKDSGFDVTDKINVTIEKHDSINEGVTKFTEYIGQQTLANSIELVETVENESAVEVELDKETKVKILLERM